MTDDADNRDGDEVDQQSTNADGQVDDARSRDGGERSGPLGNLASDLDRRRRERDEPIDDELFDEESVPEIDPDTVWEQIGSDEPPSSEPDPAEDPIERVVDSGTYCQGCEHFSAPPEVRCTHEGTEILEMVDVDRFRVVNCPVVRENERLERL